MVDGFLKFYDDNDWIVNFGLVENLCPTKFPLLVNNLRLLPFQFQRKPHSTFDIISFKLYPLNWKNTKEIINLYTDINLIENKNFTAFDQFIFDAQTDLSQTIPDGIYQIQLSGGINTWFSNYIKIENIPLSLYGFGGFSDGFSNGFDIEETELTNPSEYFILNFTNSYDLGNKIYQFGYQDVLVLDERHSLLHKFNGQKEEINIDKSTGEEIIVSDYYFEEWELSFYHNKDVAQWIAKSLILDKMTLLNRNQIETVVKEWEVEIKETSQENAYKIVITYKINLIDKLGQNVNFIEV